METKLQFNDQEYYLERYPKTVDKSLRAWSNAEILALDFIKENQSKNIHTFNDRFGIWNCTLQDKNVTTIWTYVSQQKAIHQNLQLNNFSTDVDFKTPLDNLNSVELALIKIPKSLELFELFLNQIHNASNEKTEVVCCFMTKYFSNSYLKIASNYFEEVEQSKAWKKARLLLLKHPKKEVLKKELINTLDWKNNQLKQYYGVFSSDKIDIGTQFLLENIELKSNEQKVLDVASGNGIIAFDLVNRNFEVEVSLVDDFNLAIESSKINLQNRKAHFYCAETLEKLPKNNFDLVVSNPPFHFEYENNIEVTISLFKDVKQCLRTNGRFVLVANKHLNYKTHLSKLFSIVSIVKSNTKFIVYECLS